MACASGTPLFSFDPNSTADIIQRLSKFREAYEPWHGYLCLIICSFGILTNFINVIVLTKRQMRTSINVLLTGIAFCDVGCMASYLVYIIHFVFADQFCNPDLYSYPWMVFLVCHIIFSVALHTTGLWLAVVMAFIRNMTLQRALNGSKWLRSADTWKICIVVYVCVFVLCIPSVFGSDIVEYATYFNHTCRGPERGLASEYEIKYATYTIGIPEHNCVVYTVTLWLTGTVFKIIPCILLAFLIISLLWTIKKAERRRRALFESNSTNRARLRLRQQQEANASQSMPAARSDRTTTMLVVILGLFLLTELPQGAISILTGIYVGDMREHVYPNVGDIMDLLSLINSSVNFVLYCAMSSKYRRVFWQVVLPRRVYVRRFLRPDPNNGPTQEPALGIRPARPELHVLTTMASKVQAMRDQDGERESSVVDLYQVASGKELEFSKSESGPSSVSAAPKPRFCGPSALANFPRKKLSDCNLRRRVMTRAAILAATPAMTGATSDESIARNAEVIQIGQCSTTEAAATSPVSSGPEKSIIGQKKHRWLISCSCLCKCAFRGGSGSSAAHIHARSPNRVKHTSIVAADMESLVVSNDLAPDAENLALDTGPLCPSMTIWRRCSSASQKEYVFV